MFEIDDWRNGSLAVNKTCVALKNVVQEDLYSYNILEFFYK
jgi:hypothetical protein